MFENIRPEDFFRETSAVKTEAIPEAVKKLRLPSTDLGFQVFIRQQLDRCRAEASEGEFTPQAVLANTDEYRYFHGEDDEVPADFARRLQREAKQMNAHRAFVALVAPARALMPGQAAPEIDPDDLESVSEALISGALQLGVCWTASSFNEAGQSYMGGIIYLDDLGMPAGEVSGDMDPDIADPFLEVLGWR